MTIFALLPRYFSIYGAMARATRSVPPPGEYDTIMLMGRSGYAARAMAGAATRTDSRLRRLFLMEPLFCVRPVSAASSIASIWFFLRTHRQGRSIREEGLTWLVSPPATVPLIPDVGRD
jgi:hypothetical protein